MTHKILILTQSYDKNRLKYWIPSSSYIFSLLIEIRDPEFPYQLSQLDILSIEKILIEKYILNQNIYITVTINPTYKMCTMSSVIGLSIENILYNKITGILLNEHFPQGWNWKYCTNIPHTLHVKSSIITKQLNDKERISAAIENVSIRNIIKFSYYKLKRQ